MNLEKILEKHEMWLRGEEGGERADLRNAYLWNANLIGANLSYADLSGADLWNANLKDIDLSGADLSCADLSDANLKYANLIGANLTDANLRNVCLRNADLMGADLSAADLTYADLRNVCLRDTNLKNVKTSMYTVGYNLACPEKGSFIGYKKANRYIIKLLILEDAKRSSATTMKCRCNKTKVLDIEDIETGEKVKEISSDYDPNFTYKVGEIVTVKDFDEDRWNECAPGIHFFMNKENALKY